MSSGKSIERIYLFMIGWGKERKPVAFFAIAILGMNVEIPLDSVG